MPDALLDHRQGGLAALPDALHLLRDAAGRIERLSTEQIEALATIVEAVLVQLEAPPRS